MIVHHFLSVEVSSLYVTRVASPSWLPQAPVCVGDICMSNLETSALGMHVFLVVVVVNSNINNKNNIDKNDNDEKKKRKRKRKKKKRKNINK